MKKVLAVLAAVGMFGALGSSAHALDVNWTGLGDGVKWSDSDNWDVASGLWVNNRKAIIDQANYSGDVTMLQSKPNLHVNSLVFRGTGSDTLTLNGLQIRAGNSINSGVTILAEDSADVTINTRLLSESGNVQLALQVFDTARLTLNAPFDVNDHSIAFSAKNSGTLDLNSKILNATQIAFYGTIRTNSNFETATTVRANANSSVYAKGKYGSVVAKEGSLFIASSCVNTGNVIAETGSTLRFGVGGPNSCLGYTRLNVSGVVRIASGAKLAVLSSGLDGLVIGDECIIVRNDGTDAITGRFFGKPEGREITAGPMVFEISYRGGDGNDVSLTLVRIEN